MLTVVALETDETLLILKIAFLVLLYGFIVLVVRSATKGMDQAPQESIILGAAEAAALRAEHGLPPTRLLVVTSPGAAGGSDDRGVGADRRGARRAQRDPARP